MIWCRFPIPHSKWVHIIFEGTMYDMRTQVWLTTSKKAAQFGSKTFAPATLAHATVLLACLPMNFIVMRLLYLDLLDNHEIEEISGGKVNIRSINCHKWSFTNLYKKRWIGRKYQRRGSRWLRNDNILLTLIILQCYAAWYQYM